MDATDDRPLLLGGSWVERDAVLEVRDPEDGSLVGRTAVASVQDAQLAVTMAETASPLPRAERSSVLERAAERVDERAAELAETIAREGIKTIREARREVGRCATTLRLAASEARTVEAMEIDEDAMWANLAYFLDALAPVAEEAGVRLALHPDDPPVAELGGIARILRDVDALERALALADSPAVGLNLCLGTLSARGGEAVVLDAIARFGARDQIVCVHFRDVRGTVPAFEECFLGEGNYDPLEVMRALLATGFSGFMLDDHVPRLVGDTDYAHRGRAHAVGYLQALLLAAHGDPPEVAHRLDPLARGHS